VIGALYDLQSGTVTWLGNHPNEIKLLATALTQARPHGPAPAPKIPTLTPGPLPRTTKPALETGAGHGAAVRQATAH
jgi:hypothetical protein